MTDPSLAHGDPTVAIPGPSSIPARVLSAMHRAMPNIYGDELIETSFSVLGDLPKIARTEGDVFVSVSNGHGAWEMALTNTLCRGDRVLVLESGRFAIGWGEMAEMLGVQCEVLPAGANGAIDADAVGERLAADLAGSDDPFAAILMVQTDTATSVNNDVAAVRSAMDHAGHAALLMVDCIASLGCERYEMDEWGVDITVAGSQKGLMVPPGLGFVWRNDKAAAAHDQADLRTGYWDWTARSSGGPHYLIYAGTPPVQHIWAMREALDMLFDEGLENVWARHRVMASAVHAAVDAWSAPSALRCNIDDPVVRSNAVTTVLTGDIDAERIRSIAESQAQLTLGVGLADFEGRAFRIGHMGHLNPPMLLGALGTIESTLHAIDAPMGGSGVAAAAQVLGEAIARR